MDTAELNGGLDLTKGDVRAKVIKEAAARYADAELREDEFTAQQYAEELGLGNNQARCRLKGDIERGNLDRRKVLLNGHWQWAYRIAENP